MSAQFNFYWIWPRSSTVLRDGSIVFKTSGWDRGETHWSGNETVVPSSGEFGALMWIHQNRRVLPPLIEKGRIPAKVESVGQLVAPPDGIYFLGDADIIADWGDQLRLPVRKANNEQSETMQLLAMLACANCLVFVNGQCEAALSVGAEATDTSVTSQQAMSFLHALLEDAPPIPDPPPP